MENEIVAVVELLSILDPIDDPDDYFNPEKALKRFWKYYERREAMERGQRTEVDDGNTGYTPE